MGGKRRKACRPVLTHRLEVMKRQDFSCPKAITIPLPSFWPLAERLTAKRILHFLRRIHGGGPLGPDLRH